MAEDPRLFSLNPMLTENTKERLGTIDVGKACDLFRLSDGQRELVIALMTSDPKLSGLRSDGSLPIGIAVKLCRAAKEAKC